jgi:predicted N-acetyltransferase YhbS
MPPDIVIVPEHPSDAVWVEELYEIAFGPGRFARTGHLLRGGLPHDPATSFVAERRDIVLGAIRQNRITVGGAPAYLLGPLAVAETAAKQGIGRALLHRSIDAARATRAEAIVLVGDYPFYGPSGFEPVGEAIRLTVPVDRRRLLMLPLRRPLSGLLVSRAWEDEPGAAGAEAAEAIPAA